MRKSRKPSLLASWASWAILKGLEPGGCMLQAIHRQQWNEVCIAHNGDGPGSKQIDANWSNMIKSYQIQLSYQIIPIITKPIYTIWTASFSSNALKYIEMLWHTHTQTNRNPNTFTHFRVLLYSSSLSLSGAHASFDVLASGSLGAPFCCHAPACTM